MVEVLTAHRELNRSVLNAETEKRVEEAISNGVEMTNAVEEGIRNEVIAAIARYMPVKYDSARILYHYDTGVTFVSGSDGTTKTAIRALSKLFEKLHRVQPHGKDQKMALTSRLRSHLEGVPGSFNNFDLASSLVLKGEGSDGSVISVSGIDLSCGNDELGLIQALKFGSQVNRIRLNFRKLYLLTLDPGLKIKSIKAMADDNEPENEQENEQENIQPVDEVYAESASVALMLYVDMFKEICALINEEVPGKPLPSALKTNESIADEAAEIELANMTIEAVEEAV